MKWVRFEMDGELQFGVLEGDTVSATSSTWEDILEGKEPNLLGTSYPLSDLNLAAPVPRPAKIIAIGQNYMDHCREQNSEPPKAPLIFAKFSTTQIGPGDTVSWSPSLTQKVDLEAELAVVIGKTARRVSQETALDHVLGYTCGNDISARDLQFGDKQWVRGKSLDTFCPLGPALVTTAEISNPQGLKIRSELNGRVMQESNTNEMIFNVAHLVSYCSKAFTLEPGDVIMTGTPDGVGVFQDPPVFLKDGDTVAVEIEGIGRIENPCKFEDD